jgi:GAF domain-containing protein
MFGWARVFADAAREIGAAPGPQETLRTIADLATRVTGCDWAAIAKSTEQTPVVAATSDHASAEMIAKIQASGGGGPTWAAVKRGRTIYVRDVETETRWPAHVKELRATTPVRSILGQPLVLENKPIGALTLYSSHVDAFPPPVAELAAVYADHAALALDHALAGEQLDHLESALVSSREIGIALGILMERYKITSNQAFDMLRVVSQHSHRKLRDIAGELALTGQLETKWLEGTPSYDPALLPMPPSTN